MYVGQVDSRICINLAILVTRVELALRMGLVRLEVVVELFI